MSVEVVGYNSSTEGNVKVTNNFTVKEFKSSDSKIVFIHKLLPQGLQKKYKKKNWLQRKFKKKADRYLFVNIAFVVVFTIAMIITFYIKGSIPDSLVDLVKYVCGFECGCLAYIKGSNIKNGG